MYDSNGRLHRLIFKVEVVLPHLSRQQKALVNHRTGTHGRHKVFGTVFELEVMNAVRRRFTDDVEFSLQRILHHHVRPAPDKDLPDNGFARLHRRTHFEVSINRNVAPPQQHLAVPTYGTFQFLFAGRATRRLLRQENHSDTVVPGSRKHHALCRHFRPIKRVRNLNQNTGAVPAERIRPDRTAVIQIAQNQQGVFNGSMRLSTF